MVHRTLIIYLLLNRKHSQYAEDMVVIDMVGLDLYHGIQESNKVKLTTMGVSNLTEQRIIFKVKKAGPKGLSS